MKKRVAIIGKGTAGSQAVAHYLKYMPGYEIEWHYDPNVKVQSVGEGSTPHLLKNLFECLDFNHLNIKQIDGALKTGIYKSGWGDGKENFLHQFVPPIIAYHFNAVVLQDYILEKVKDKVKIYEHSVKSEDIDADFIMDCSGKPKSYEDFHRSPYIPVNAAYVTECPWEYPRFQHTLTITRPYGWVFGIPLQNRCSIGYLFNKNINNVDEVKEDVKNVLEEYNLISIDKTQYLEFENYYRKQNYTNRIAHNGNSSFFLEPLEATSIALTTYIQRQALDVWNKTAEVEESNAEYKKILHRIETMIMLHYFSGSKYNTEFWDFARDRGQRCIETAIKYDNKFKQVINHVFETPSSNLCDVNLVYGYWNSESFHQNIHGLGIKNKLLNLMK